MRESLGEGEPGGGLEACSCADTPSWDSQGQSQAVRAGLQQQQRQASQSPRPLSRCPNSRACRLQSCEHEASTRLCLASMSGPN